MPTKLENLFYKTAWNDCTVDYYEGYRTTMVDFHMHDYYEVSLILTGNVKVLLSDKGMEVTYVLVGSNEANPLEGKISDQAPIGAALIGKRADDEIEVEVPNGIIRMKVLEVSRTQG